MADGRVVRGALRPQRHEHLDRLAVELAERQHWVITHQQLKGLGFTPDMVKYRVRAGRLYCLFRGVYAVGRPRVSPEGRWLAAVLSAGRNAVVSHRTAGALWGICAWSGATDITVPTSRRPRPGINWHVSPLPRDETTSFNAIPTTSLSRTLFDLATCLTLPRLANSLNEAEHRRLGDRVSLPDLLERYPRRAGAPLVRKVLSDHKLGDGTAESELELQFLDFLDQHELPRPEVNAWIEVDGEAFRPDCLWRRQRVIAELDSWENRGTREAFEADRVRARKLSGAGYRILNVTSRDVNHRSDALAADLHRSLRECSSP